MYSDKVMDHFEHPRNVGEIENASGVGTVGNAKCGDIMRIYLDIDENQIIRDVKFKTFGCGAAVATSSMATELVKGKSIYEAHFSKDTITELISICYQKNWYIRWYIGDTIYVRYVDMDMFPAYKTTKGLNIVEVGEDFEKYTENVTQLVVCNLNGKIQEIQDELADIFKDRIGLQQNTGYTMDITPPGIDKAVGLSKLAQYLQIDKSEIMACGDGDNDLAMIEYVGLGVAMENAIDDVKNIAQFITKDCDEDGIAYVINKFI